MGQPKQNPALQSPAEARYEKQRQYVRHPIRVPLAVRPKDGSPELTSRSGDLSEGGLSFASPRAMALGSAVEVDLPVNARRFTLLGTVRSCIVADEGYRVGVAFEEPSAHFRMKLAEQVLRIAELQRELSEERGVEVSSREAAQAWVDQYAETFAQWYPES
jgi:hypothetical protein